MVLIKNTEYAYTDGSVTNNGKSFARGGSGIFFGTDDPRNMALRFNIKPITTPRTELYAVYKAMEMYIKSYWNELHNVPKLKPRKKLFIYSDSEYTVKCVQTWMDTWKRNEWKKKNGSPVENLDLIKAIYNIKHYYIEKLQIKLIHIKSHQNPPKDINSEEYMHWYGNYMADKLAAMGRRTD
jgi:ribonuclease HI